MIPNRLAGLPLLVVFVLAACAAETSPSAPTPSPHASARPGATVASAATAARSGGTTTGQTDTAWGRIWDSLPSGFPTYTGAMPAEEGATGPSSADLVVDGASAKDVLTFYEARLKGSAYATEGSLQPLESGGYVLDMAGSPAGCKVQVTASPTGGITTVTILYAAACPHD